jgi:hypothetical protein
LENAANCGKLGLSWVLVAGLAIFLLYARAQAQAMCEFGLKRKR